MTRLWSLHPSLLDTKGLGGLWSEAERAQRGLLGLTKDHVYHPQLDRFKAHPEPVKAIGKYMVEVWHESRTRIRKDGKPFNYNFKLINYPTDFVERIAVTHDQIIYEFQLLVRKLGDRGTLDPSIWSLEEIPLHPLFFPVPGPIESWEKLPDV